MNNQVRKTTGSEVSEWIYDYENRQTDYKKSLDSGAYTYDAAGNRIKKTAVVAAFIM